MAGVGVGVNDEVGLEREADLMGEKAVLQRKYFYSGRPRKNLTPNVTQRLVSADQQGTQMPLLLALETRVENAVATLPAWATAPQPPHPLLDPIRNAYALARAPLGVDNDADITTQINELTPKIVAFETHVATHLAAMRSIDTVYAVFNAQLRDETTAALTKLAWRVYTCKALALEFPDLKRKIDREAIKSNKEMKALRKANAADAIAELGHYIQAGYVAIKPLNSFYESPFDLAKDCFGAAAGLESNADTGLMQWLTQWEFHVHANVTRAAPVAPATVGAINGFSITRGHIKPSAAERALGVSIEITNAALLGQVVANSWLPVSRWAATPKGEEVLRGKKG